ncbi:putative rhomboid protease YdcA [Robertmurraya siralis]|uniref:Rhomboid protease YdcA n=1 Tax=Robertmurraya siralis TaxID=77777 RepID=A0A919WK37_9BACI|nr:rhomboid family intramembrane serine protease [Robertmurraya siralis]PAE19840.1 rhomboid family intramembrane serine protease [Bacillus sp. 7504-2]GIN63508.1 putative rhomboid protease YdcA [Robertmurraya siralis]
MFVRTESFKEFIRYYPVVSVIIFLHIMIYMLTSIPAIFPSASIFESLMGVNLYIVQGEYWRLVTPIFVHSGIAHMLFNSFSLVLFGPGLERILGKSRFILLYLATGVLANVATLILKPLTYTHVGSSGSIFGLFGIYLAIVFLRKELMSRQNSQVILTIAVIGVIMTFLQPNINITAHIFGLITGFILGAIQIGRGRALTESIRNISLRRSSYSAGKRQFHAKHLIWIAIALLALLGLLGGF